MLAFPTLQGYDRGNMPLRVWEREICPSGLGRWKHGWVRLG